MRAILWPLGWLCDASLQSAEILLLSPTLTEWWFRYDIEFALGIEVHILWYLVILYWAICQIFWQYCSIQNHPMSSSTRHCPVHHLCHCKSPQFKAFDLFINDSQMTLALSVIFLSQLLQQYVFLLQGVSSHKYEFSGHLLSVLKIKAEMQWKRNEKKKISKLIYMYLMSFQ